MKNHVTDAKHDPNIVMHVCIFKLGGWNTSQPSIQTSLDEVVVGIPHRELFLVIQFLEQHYVSSDPHMKKDDVTA